MRQGERNSSNLICIIGCRWWNPRWKMYRPAWARCWARSYRNRSKNPGRGQRQGQLSYFLPSSRQTVLTGDHSREQTFRTDSGRIRATTVEVAAGIVAGKGTWGITAHSTALIWNRKGRVSGRIPPGRVCPGQISKQTTKLGMGKTELWKQTREPQPSITPTGSSESVLLRPNNTRNNRVGGVEEAGSNGIDPDELEKPGLLPMTEVVAGGMAIRALIGSGATTNLLHLGAYKRMPNPTLMTIFFWEPTPD